MAEDRRRDPAARHEACQIVDWAKRLMVTPEELRSAVQKGGELVLEVSAEVRRRSQQNAARDLRIGVISAERTSP